MKKFIIIMVLAFFSAKTMQGQLVNLHFKDCVVNFEGIDGDGVFTSTAEITFFFDKGFGQVPANLIYYEHNTSDENGSFNVANCSLSNQPFGIVDNLYVTAFEDDCGSRNIYNKGNCDKPRHCGSGAFACADEEYGTNPDGACDINLNAYAPEKYAPYFCDANDGAGHYTLHYNFKYTFPKLTPPTSINSNGRNCDNRPFTLTTSLPQSLTERAGVRYIWKYSLDNTVFISFDTTSTDTIVFDPWVLFPVLDTAQFITDIQFRVEGLNDDGHSGESTTSHYEFAPKAPIAQFVTGHPSCLLSTTGTIEIANIQRVTPDTKFILRSEPNDTLGCDPNNIASCISILSGNIAGLSADIPNIPLGSYTLLLANSGGAPSAAPNSDHGACYTWYNVVIDTVPDLVHVVDSTQNLSCFQSNDGAIYLRCNKTQAPYTFEMLPQAGALVQNDTAAMFTNLPAGTYTVKVKDFCNIYTNQDTIVISEPLPLTTSATIVNQANCFAPYNGVVTIAANNAAAYTYRLSADGVWIDSLTNTSAGSWNLSGLSPASYTYSVQDVAKPNCPLTYGSFDITMPIPLQATYAAAAVTCYGGTDGQVSVVASGGQQGDYLFRLALGVNTIATNNTGQFLGLSAGTYSVVVRNNNISCQDSVFISAINVNQPMPLSANIIKQNVSCSGSNNGSITATPNGGIAPYAFQWQFLAGVSWVNYTMGGQGNGSSLTGLFPTSYRVNITDANNCMYTSAAESIIEPNSLTVDSIIKQDVVCFGGTGSLHIFGQGGTLPYQLRVSADNGTTFTAYANDAPLYTGNYIVEISDAGGCVLTYPQAFNITQPLAMLDAQVNLPYYNGYQIACNGSMTDVSFAATGGNGNGYFGYLFSLNNSSFGTDSIFANLAAGQHQIRIADGRGCIATRSFEVLQPNELQLNETANVGTVCANVASGAIEVMASGGVSPFLYAIDTSAFIASTLFDSLLPGSYVIRVKDANGCQDTIEVFVSSQYTALTLQEDIKNVTCWGLTDGEFDVAAQGGASGYTYQWLYGGLPTGTQHGQNLSADTYVVKVTDLANCTDTFDVVVQQPDTALYAALFVQAICPGNVGGMAVAHAQGGTVPYTFALNNGIFSSDSTFSSLPLGAYTLTISDSNHCTFIDTFSIQPLAQPDVRFLVASKEYAHDTLVFVNVSLPVVDSVQWVFPVQAQVHKVDRDSAWVTYPDTGSYPVQMTAFYQNCPFAIVKDIEVTQKDSITVDPDSDKEILNFSVSPNPTSGQIHITVNLNKEQRYLHLRLVDAVGNDLWHNTVQDVQDYVADVDVLQQAAAGTYFLVAITETEYEKLVIVKQ